MLEFIVTSIRQQLDRFTLAIVLGMSLMGPLLGGCLLALTQVKSTSGTLASPAQDKDINRRELGYFDRFLDNHSKDVKELNNKPSLINDLDWMAKHPQLQAFLRNHPRIRKDLKEHPAPSWSRRSNLSVVSLRQTESRSEKTESANKDAGQQAAFLNLLALLMLAY
jgi:hypothetical protein